MTILDRYICDFICQKKMEKICQKIELQEIQYIGEYYAQ